MGYVVIESAEPLGFRIEALVDFQSGSRSPELELEPGCKQKVSNRTRRLDAKSDHSPEPHSRRARGDISSPVVCRVCYPESTRSGVRLATARSTGRKRFRQGSQVPDEAVVPFASVFQHEAVPLRVIRYIVGNCNIVGPVNNGTALVGLVNDVLREC